jgi:hypothetical protein
MLLGEYGRRVHGDSSFSVNSNLFENVKILSFLNEQVNYFLLKQIKATDT